MNARQNFTVRLTRLEAIETSAAAKQAGVSAAEYVRRALTQAKSGTSKQNDSAEREQLRDDFAKATRFVQQVGQNMEAVLSELRQTAAFLKAARPSA